MALKALVPLSHKMSKCDPMTYKNVTLCKFVPHPERRPEVVDLADATLSTDGMIAYAAKSEDREFIVATELEVVNRMMEDNPNKEFFAIEKAYCRTQKKVKLENVLKALETLEPKVSLSRDIIERARLPIERMLAVGRADLVTAGMNHDT